MSMKRSGTVGARRRQVVPTTTINLAPSHLSLHLPAPLGSSSTASAFHALDTSRQLVPLAISISSSSPHPQQFDLEFVTKKNKRAERRLKPPLQAMTRRRPLEAPAEHPRDRFYRTSSSKPDSRAVWSNHLHPHCLFIASSACYGS
jgi:hypothetical protein